MAKTKDDGDNFNNHGLELIEKTIENYPIKETVNFLKDEMERSRQHELQLLRLLTNQAVNQTPDSYGNAAVPSLMYDNTVSNTPSFPVQPSYMYPPLHEGQSYPDSQNV